MHIETIRGYDAGSRVLRHPQLAQSLYDDGAVIMADVLLVLHGAAHKARRATELQLFRRNYFRYYEGEVFPATLAQTMAPFVRAGRADLIELGYRVTLNLSADFAGIDRPQRTEAETEALLALVMKFSEGATLVHSTRDKDTVRAEVRAALAEFDRRHYQPSLERRRLLLQRLSSGDIGEDDLPRDLLTVLLRYEDRIDMSPELMRRETAFYLQAGSHSTANATTHAFHDIVQWSATHPDDAARIAAEPLFLQRCVHESLRLHPASPVAWRRPMCPVALDDGHTLPEDARVIVDLAAANRDVDVFGPDADRFNPHRRLPEGVPPWGLTFGTGLHTCLGRDLDGGLAAREDTDPDTHQYGIVPLFIQALLAHKARPDPQRPPAPAHDTQRPNWGSYPILLDDLP